MLGLLCLQRGAVIPVDQLVDDLWGGSPPPTASHMIEVYVSKLRKLLGPGVIVTRSPGYLLDLDHDRVDSTQFELLVAQATDALGHGEPQLAAAQLDEALHLWRGEALIDFRYESFAQQEIARLDGLRALAEEERIEAELALGRAADLISEIETLVAAEPLRERRYRHLMLALYRAGRQADALAAYRRAREALVDELGIEPGPDLQMIERAILNQDDSVLGFPPNGQTESASVRDRPLIAFPAGFLRGRRARLGLVFTALLAAAVAIPVFALPSHGVDEAHSPTKVAIVPNSVVVIDPQTAQVVGDVPVGRTPGPVVFGGGAIWVGNYEDKTISRIDPRTREVVTLGIAVRPYGLSVGEGALWFTDRGSISTPATVGRRDLLSDRIDSISLGPGNPFGGDVDPRGAPSLVGRSMPVAVEDGIVWVARRYYSEVVMVNASTQKIMKRVRGPDAAGIATSGETVWVVNFYDDTLWRLDSDSARVVAKIPVGEAPCCVAATEEAVWVVSRRTEVWRISPRSNTVEGTIDVGETPVAIAAADGFIWVANYGDSSISRINARTYEVTTTKTQRRPVGIAVGGGAVWATVDQ